MNALPQMTGAQYLGFMLAKYAIPTGPGSPAMNAFAGIVPVLKHWAHAHLSQVFPSGSFAKGTTVAGTTDIDIFISLKETTPGTLEELYESLYGRAQTEGWAPRRQNVSIGITYGGARVDLVSGRLQPGSSTYHSLWRRRVGSWTQTNVGLHVATVRSSNRTNEIRLMKIWRQCHGLDFPSFYLELMVIRALSGCLNNLESNVQRALKYFNENLETACVIDPSNTHNIISDDFTQAEKKAIAVQAGKSHDTPAWHATLW